MRSRQLRLQPVRVAAGATLIGVAGTAVALAAGPADAQNAGQNATHLGSLARHLHAGQVLTVNGSTAAAEAGQPVVLEFAPSGSGRWRNLVRSNVNRTGGFGFRVRLTQSGRLRVAGAASGAADRGSVHSAADGAARPMAPSQTRSVTVGSVLSLRSADRAVLAGQTLVLGGRLLPATAGRWVALQGFNAGHWRTLTIARTGPRGGFMLHLHPAMGGPRGLRVRFAGDRLNTGTSHGAGKVVVFREAVASWYDDGGATACGFHAGYGVASPYLPCGTQVTFRYGGHSVTATVDDRGPYVSGRDFDLNQNTAGALGFSGVDTVWATS